MCITPRRRDNILGEMTLIKRMLHHSSTHRWGRREMVARLWHSSSSVSRTATMSDSEAEFLSVGILDGRGNRLALISLLIAQEVHQPWELVFESNWRGCIWQILPIATRSIPFTIDLLLRQSRFALRLLGQVILLHRRGSGGRIQWRDIYYNLYGIT